MNSFTRGSNVDSSSPPIDSSSGDSPNSLGQNMQHLPQPTMQQFVASTHFIGPTPVIIVPQDQNQQSFVRIPAGVPSLAAQNNESEILSSNFQKALPKTKWYYIGQDGETYGMFDM